MDADFLLIRKIKQGDEKAFDLFIRKYYKEILTYCNYHCFDKGYAEDLTQETFARFFEKVSDYHYKGKTKNYLYTISGNLCRDFYKKKKEIPIKDMELSEKIEPVEHQMSEVENKLTIEWALKQLPNEFHEVLILYYFQELKLKEIADVLKISLPLVKYRLKQAKIQLGKLLGEEGIYEFGRTTYEL
ncbi:RNA polymerase sigma factor [Anaeromicropila populeti]|uniref:RNA polymerase sigma-70 factor, ECF subfamily n=1 Tax=Anaeromicropila populeti TaxID=37658 RepID=A0A1I6I705_9FIRM|nr:RNA polymerase sigma factor [Anaeromicropila populeti]SFR62527.1 RNA polymerase sigma-70 factor, ECF subfamily [Anaeromicropila populeti]